MTTRENILKYIKLKNQVSAAELVEYLEISRQALFKHLSKLQDEDKIYKIGKPPKVFYFINEKKIEMVEELVEEDIKKRIDDQYLIITPSGERKEGWAGFVYWCDKNNQPLAKTAEEYLKTCLKYDVYRDNGFIVGTSKMKNTLKVVNLDEVLYLDFYSIERFGKTKLGQLLLYAKQSQNKSLMKEIIKEIKPRIDKIIKKYRIDGIGYIPPTVKREIQLMKVLEKGLHENARRVSITKIKTEVSIPQKTLNKLEDRVENARNTMVVEENSRFNNILLIDDAVGSGATFNEVAKKIRDKKICKGKIIGLAIVGSFKGFDVISEV